MLPVTLAPVGGGPAPVEAPFGFAAVAALLPKASAESGEGIYKRCAACHITDKSGKAGPLGPNLWNVINRDIASTETFAPRYSAALKGKKGKWTFDALANYLNDPRGYIPGSQMAFAGIKDNQELADVLVYLRSLSDSPAALP